MTYCKDCGTNADGLPNTRWTSEEKFCPRCRSVNIIKEEKNYE